MRPIIADLTALDNRFSKDYTVRDRKEAVMPLYDYVCVSCGARWEAQRPMADRDGASVCPACEGDGRRAFISAPMVPWYPGSTRVHKDRLKVGDPSA